MAHTPPSPLDQAHVIRTLRNRGDRIAEAAKKRGQAAAPAPPTITLSELQAAFDGMAIASPDIMMRLLREE
jgi:hypothetical protein